MNWTSAKDDLPKKDGFYWCYLAECPPQSYPQQAIRYKEKRWWTSWVVSHWMELPEPPRS